MEGTEVLKLIGWVMSMPSTINGVSPITGKYYPKVPYSLWLVPPHFMLICVMDFQKLYKLEAIISAKFLLVGDIMICLTERSSHLSHFLKKYKYGSSSNVLVFYGICTVSAYVHQ